jgi:hypothetical protein
MAYKYTDEQKKFIKNNIKGNLLVDLVKIFNKKFDEKLEYSQMRGYVRNHKLTSGINTKFKKGNKPLYSFKKGNQIGKKTRFKKGNKPHNTDNIGTEKLTTDGYLKIKIAEPNVWKYKHKLVYEKYKGKISEGNVVIFGDSNKSNCSIENLICISREELLILNKNGLIKENVELTKTGIIISKIYQKMNEKIKGDEKNE